MLYKTEVQRSEFGFERRSIGVTELSRLRGSEGYADCDDAGVRGAFFFQDKRKPPRRFTEGAVLRLLNYSASSRLRRLFAL